MRVQRCKGTRDLSPEEMIRFRHIEEIFRDSCLGWGFREVRTPTIEYLHLFTSAGTLTPSMLGKVYSFLDWDGWSGERVVLRPDGTIPIARMYIDSLAEKGLARLFYVANTFIFEATGNKTRERWQCGTELIGLGSPLADAHLVLLALETLQRLGLGNVRLRLSHAGLIKELLASLDLTSEEQSRVFDQVLDGNSQVLTRMESKRPELENILLPLLNLKGKSSGFLKNLRALSASGLPGLVPYLDDFIKIVEILEEMGCKYQVDIASGAGFEYYTGVIFQLYAGKEKIGGGGRYDALIPAMGGGDVPASGFALYVDRLLGLLGTEFDSRPQASGITVRAESDDAIKAAFTAAGEIRRAGHVAELDLGVGKSSDLPWTLTVRNAAPPFRLVGKAKSVKVELPTVEEVLKIIQKK